MPDAAIRHARRRSYGLAVAAALLLAGCADEPVRVAAPPNPAILPQDAAAAQLALVNAERARRGLPGLRTTPELSEAARAHAEDMVGRHYFSHESPDGTSAADRYHAAGGSPWEMVAENIADCRRCGRVVTMADLAEFHRGWMNNPGHRGNILDAGLTAFGFAVVTDGRGRQVAVQDFAGPGASMASVERIIPASVPAGLPGLGRERGEALLQQAVNAERRRAGAPALDASIALSAAAGLLLERTMDAAHRPGGGLGGFTLEETLPAELLTPWREMVMLAGACGGCGAVVTDGDAAYFEGTWLAAGANRRELLENGFTHLGFAMAADGGGGKFAIAVLAR